MAHTKLCYISGSFVFYINGLNCLFDSSFIIYNHFSIACRFGELCLYDKW